MGKYTQSKAFQDMLPEDGLLTIVVRHQFQIKQVEGETKIGHKFGDDSPEWSKQIFLRIYKLLGKYGNKYPRDWCKEWLNWNFIYKIRITKDIIMNLQVHPWFCLALLDKKVLNGFEGQIKFFCRQEAKKRKLEKWDVPLIYFNEMIKFRNLKDSDVVTEELPVMEEIPDIEGAEPIEDLHDVEPSPVFTSVMKDQCEECGKWYKKRGMTRHMNSAHSKVKK